MGRHTVYPVALVPPFQGWFVRAFFPVAHATG